MTIAIAVFDNESRSWVNEQEYNLMFLRSQENYLNDVLRVRGHVFLNDVFDALGINRTSAGAVKGWLHTEEAPNHISFGPCKPNPNGAIPLTFNIDGIIYDKI